MFSTLFYKVKYFFKPPTIIEPPIEPPPPLQVTPEVFQNMVLPAKEKIQEVEVVTSTKAIGAYFESAVELRKYLFATLNGTIAWQGIVLHHSETDDDGKKSNFEAIRRHHKEVKKWSEIGYHLVIERDQNQLVVKLGRPLTTGGAHAVGFNGQYVGICIIGNYDHYKPDSEVWNFTLECVRVLMELYKIPKEKVIGHRETYKERGVPVEKLCPGSFWDLGMFRLMI